MGRQPRPELLFFDAECMLFPLGLFSGLDALLQVDLGFEYEASLVDTIRGRVGRQLPDLVEPEIHRLDGGVHLKLWFFHDNPIVAPAPPNSLMRV